MSEGRIYIYPPYSLSSFSMMKPPDRLFIGSRDTHPFQPIHVLIVEKTIKIYNFALPKSRPSRESLCQSLQAIRRICEANEC
jgi:hypothetical protein